MSILVTGASGNLGRLVVLELLARGVPAADIVATGRAVEKLDDLRPAGVQVRRADFADPAGLPTAFAGVATLLLVSTTTVGERSANHRRAIDAARAAGVARIVYTSALNADTATMRLAHEHLETEQYLRESGVAWTILRNGWYLENYTAQLPMIREHGTVVGSAQDGRVSAASRADYAAAVAAVLTGDGHSGRVYELGGDRAFTLSELAATVSATIGKPITYSDLSPDALATVLRDAGLPSDLAEVLADADAGLARGELFTDSTHLQELLGRPTTTLEDAVVAACH